MFPFLIIAMAVMYFMMVMPKRKQDRERRQMLTDMKRGDEVQTIGGVIGKVVDPREDRVLIKVDESSNTKIWFARSAIARVTAEDVKAAVGKETR
jgi:preprotein translocase subunit YajC